MIRVSNLSLDLNYTDDSIKKAVCKELRIPNDAVEKLSIFKRSIDARKKNDIRFNITVDVILNINENRVIGKSRSNKANIVEPYEYKIPEHKPLNYRPVIVGFGPAGMFAGLILAKSGEKPIIIEQGSDADTRIKDIENFIKTRKLNTNSNIQFGEGGAGTFSDGKLNTGTKDPRARNVLMEFYNHSAPEEILYNSKPHIGTDNLRIVVKNIRKEIISLGGEVRFNTKLTDIKTIGNILHSVEVESNGHKDIIETNSLILAIGHSSRDTFKMLFDKGVYLEQKSFSIGARIEHLREDIDKSQFGSFAGNERLGSAPYKLSTHLSNGRGVYTFCMCPGGEVVPAASEENTICTNGMSEFARNKENSNSALLVGISPNDFNSTHPLSGIELQRKIEHNAFVVAGNNYCAPVQKVGDFLENRCSKSFGCVKPSYQMGTTFAKTDDYLPEYITNSMRLGIVEMDKKLKGFANPDAVLTGPETRSSSPVRITRDDNLESINIKGLYPCGEGAGYAGGIVSAAVDGIKCAERILTK